MTAFHCVALRAFGYTFLPLLALLIVMGTVR